MMTPRRYCSPAEGGGHSAKGEVFAVPGFWQFWNRTLEIGPAFLAVRADFFGGAARREHAESPNPARCWAVRPTRHLGESAGKYLQRQEQNLVRLGQLVGQFPEREGVSRIGILQATERHQNPEAAR